MTRLKIDHIVVTKRSDEMTGRKDSIEAALEAAAQGLAKAAGTTREAAYAKLLDTDAGRGAAEALYGDETAKHRNRMAPNAADAIAKCAPLEDRLDEMAGEEASRSGETFEKSYARALKSHEGRELYKRICEFQAQAQGA